MKKAEIIMLMNAGFTVSEIANLETAQTPAVTAQTPAVTAQTPAVTAQTPAVTAQTPAATAQTPAVTAQNPAVTAQTPAVTAQTPAVTTQTSEPTMKDVLAELNKMTNMLAVSNIRRDTQPQVPDVTKTLNSLFAKPEVTC